MLQLRGTFRRDRHGDPATEIQFEPLAALPPCPSYLDAIGAAEWARVGPELVAAGVLCEADVTAFALYCVNVARVAACEAVISAGGLTLKTPQGFEQARPEIAISRQCGAEVRKFAQEFGLTPSARTRVRVLAPAPAAPSNPFAETAANE